MQYNTISSSPQHLNNDSDDVSYVFLQFIYICYNIGIKINY